MRKKFIGAFLLGLLALGTAGTITSCKDYDGDISSLKNDVSALESAKATLESEVASLKSQLESAQGKISTLESTVATKANQSALDDEITRAKAQEAALEARIKAAEDAIATINDLMAKKVDQDVYDAKVKEIEAALAALGVADQTEAKTREDADAAIQLQIDALKKFQEEQLKNNDEQKASIDLLIKDLEALQARVKANEDSISTINASLKALQDKVDALTAEVNTLTLLYGGALRSLVFIPQSYYYGVEATTLSYLQTNAVKELPAAAYNVKETKGYSDDSRYETESVSRVLKFAAQYQMNPSSADLTGASYAVISNDLAFVTGRAAACGLAIDGTPTYANGVLTVNLNATDPSLIKSVLNDKQITNFATQVNISKGGKNAKDTTITSDYATLYSSKVTGIHLAHAANTKTNPINLYANAAESALSPCEKTNNIAATSHGHLMQTLHEAGVTFAAQDSIEWNSEGIDLKQYVETHWFNVEGQEEKIDSATFNANFEYKFELTALYKGDNATSESAHASLNGSILKPCAVDKDGNPVAEQVRAQEVGRTPVVRVSIVDKKTQKVYDYGYIRFNIVDKITPAELKADKYISYTGAGYAYNYECTPLGWSYKTTWSVTEVDLYKELGLTREEFQKNYNQKPDGDEDNLNQYVLSSNGKTFTMLESKSDWVGTVSTVTDETASGNAQMSSTLKWEMDGATAKKFFVDKAYTVKPGTGIAVKYSSKDKTVGPDVYVVFNTNADAVTINKPAGDVAWNKNTTVWAATNAAETGTGLNEIHVNVPSVEDAKTTTAKPFEQTFSNVFVGNKVCPAGTITVSNDKTAGKEFAETKLTKDLVFDSSNIGKKFNGASGAVYVDSISADGKTLYACKKADYPNNPQAVAIISGSTVDNEKISYQETAYAKDLLNYKSHSELDDNTLTAVVALIAQNACHKLDLTNNTFNVRFLRPLNITNTSAEVEDANTTALQTIDLMKLLTFTDWRDAWSTTKNYQEFYGITGVTIEGVADGQKISTNAEVTTNQNGNTDGKSLAAVNGAIDFTYSSTNMGQLTYKNYNSTTADFWVKVPVLVHYIWGEVPQTIQINVKHTHAN